jgi:hypothetical protein
MNLADFKYRLSHLPWMAMASGFFLYLGDLTYQGVAPHINSLVHETGHFIFGKLANVPVASVNIGASDNLIVPVFKVGQTLFNIHRSTLKSYVDPGVSSPPVLFFFGGPVMSMLWGVLLAYFAKRISARPGRFYEVLTIVLAIGALDSFFGRGVFNLLPLYPASDGAKIIAALF